MLASFSYCYPKLRLGVLLAVSFLAEWHGSAVGVGVESAVVGAGESVVGVEALIGFLFAGSSYDLQVAVLVCLHPLRGRLFLIRNIPRLLLRRAPTSIPQV